MRAADDVMAMSLADIRLLIELERDTGHRPPMLHDAIAAMLALLIAAEGRTDAPRRRARRGSW